MKIETERRTPVIGSEESTVDRRERILSTGIIRVLMSWKRTIMKRILNRRYVRRSCAVFNRRKVNSIVCLANTPLPYCTIS